MNQIPKEWILIAVGFILLSAAFFGLNRVTNIGDGSVPALPPANTGSSQIGQGSLQTNGSAADVPPSHVVQAGETLQGIANQYNLPIETLIELNAVVDPNVLSAGQRLYLPAESKGTADTTQAADVQLILIIPDSELVFGPSAKGFDVNQVVPSESYLRTYQGTVEGTPLGGIAIVQLVAERTRVHPRLLLAALEFRTNWLTQSNPNIVNEAMMGNSAGPQGLYGQLEWAANRLNLGYYGRSEGGLTGITLADGGQVLFSPEINNGTAGVQNWLAATSDYDRWVVDASANGFYATYKNLFGDPFSYADEAFWPPNDVPEMLLPWESGVTWYFTGGPHGGWISGSGWGALDFVPPEEKFGCYESDAWVTAVADGVVTRSDFGAVVLDLDGDGFAGTGWAILYQHIATRDRVQVGTKLRAGEKIGHPSCEGGYSSGTHLHIARMYNGRWVSADGAHPFNMSGWVSAGSGSEYNGSLSRNGTVQDATIGRLPDNAIGE
ncbi:MAG: LysM peptidoglycan-binding domain-containing protein [Candidatus Promineifilaceae bacterium]